MYLSEPRSKTWWKSSAMSPRRSFGPPFLKSYVTTGMDPILLRMSGTSTVAMFSLNVRDDAAVNCVEPALMLEDGVEQPIPEEIPNCDPGAEQPMPALPPLSVRSFVAPVAEVEKSTLPAPSARNATSFMELFATKFPLAVGIPIVNLVVPAFATTNPGLLLPVILNGVTRLAVTFREKEGLGGPGSCGPLPER